MSLHFARTPRAMGPARAAWPSQRTQAEECGISRALVQKCLADAIEQGFLTKRQGQRRSNRVPYDIYYPRTPAEVATRGVQGGHPVMTGMDTPGVPEPLTEPLTEPMIQSAPRSASVSSKHEARRDQSADSRKGSVEEVDRYLEDIAESLLAGDGSPMTVAGLANACRNFDQAPGTTAADIRKLVRQSDLFVIGERDYVFLRSWDDQEKSA
jgi:DNA-binding transcriptional MocR family regulator